MSFHRTKKLLQMVSHGLWTWNRKLLSMRSEIPGLEFSPQIIIIILLLLFLKHIQGNLEGEY